MGDLLSDEKATEVSSRVADSGLHHTRRDSENLRQTHKIDVGMDADYG
jgi:hypothetical protein